MKNEVETIVLWSDITKGRIKEDRKRNDRNDSLPENTVAHLDQNQDLYSRPGVSFARASCSILLLVCRRPFKRTPAHTRKGIRIDFLDRKPRLVTLFLEIKTGLPSPYPSSFYSFSLSF